MSGDLADARAKAEEALAEARKAVHRWIVDDRRVPKADLVGYLVLLADLTEPLLAALPPRPAQDAVREAAEWRRWGTFHDQPCGCADCVLMRAIDAAVRGDAATEAVPTRDELLQRVEEDNAVCICGCPPEDHEDNGEGGESCSDPWHQCIRVCRTAAELYRQATLTWHTTCARCGRALAINTVTCGECCAESPQPGCRAEARKRAEGALARHDARIASARLDLSVLIQWLDNGHPKQAEQLFGITGERARLMAAGLRVLLASPPPPADAVREAEERLRDDLEYVSPARVEAEHGSDVADAIRSAEALLIALDAARGGAS